MTKTLLHLNPDKAHGHDSISIRILHICVTSILKTLEIIYRSCFEKSCFFSDWKKGNETKSIFFKTGHSYINQLLSITHKTYRPFHDGSEVREIFLDIPKAFDKVWHLSLFYKLMTNSITGNLFIILTDFLKNKKQRVVLNGRHSYWIDVEAGVPQISILGPLFLLTHFNDLSNDLVSNPKLFADDISLFSLDRKLDNSGIGFNNDLRITNRWAFQWKMSFTCDPIKQAQFFWVIFFR